MSMSPLSSASMLPMDEGSVVFAGSPDSMISIVYLIGLPPLSLSLVTAFPIASCTTLRMVRLCTLCIWFVNAMVTSSPISAVSFAVVSGVSVFVTLPLLDAIVPSPLPLSVTV